MTERDEAAEERIFASALRLQRDVIERYLDAACGADEKLRERIQSLLEAHHNAGPFLREPMIRRIARAVSEADPQPRKAKADRDRTTGRDGRHSWPHRGSGS